MQIQVVTEKSAKPTPEFLILEIPGGNCNKNAYRLSPSPLPQFFLRLSPSPGKGAKAFYPKVSDLPDYFAKNPLYIANTFH